MLRLRLYRVTSGSSTRSSMICRLEKSKLLFLITSRVSGRGYKNRAICGCVCVSVCVCEHSHGWMDWRTITKFGTAIDLDDLSDEFDGQCRRLKVKVIQLKNVILEFGPGFSVVYLTLVHAKVSPASMRRIPRMLMHILRLRMRQITKYAHERKTLTVEEIKLILFMCLWDRLLRHAGGAATL